MQKRVHVKQHVNLNQLALTSFNHVHTIIQHQCLAKWWADFIDTDFWVKPKGLA